MRHRPFFASTLHHQHWFQETFWKIQFCDRLVDFTLSTAKTREMPYFKSFTSNINVVLKICRPVSKSLWRGYHSIMSSSVFVLRKDNSNNLKPAIKGPRDGDAFWILVLEKITEMNKIFWSWKRLLMWIKNSCSKRLSSLRERRNQETFLAVFLSKCYIDQIWHYFYKCYILQMFH